MNELEALRMLARYNQWMNAKLYGAASALAEPALREDRGAFFGSIFGTLNHLVAADTIWLKRFAEHPVRHASLQPIRQMERPAALNTPMAEDFAALWKIRSDLDAIIIAWCTELAAPELDAHLAYVNMKGIGATKRTGSLLLHFFNHQTHHRGQTTTLLSQQGIDVGITDILELIPNKP